MDPRERFDAPVEALQAGANSDRPSIWTAMPGIVTNYNPALATVSVQVALRANVQKPDGTFIKVNIPPLVDVPVCFPQGGGIIMSFPIAAGDECLVVFASRNIDSWWQSGGVQDQASFRLHDLSDGFAIVGPRSRARAASGFSATSFQLRSADGSASIEMNPATGRINLTAPSGVWINGIRFDTHRHGGVQVGGGNTGVPVP